MPPVVPAIPAKPSTSRDAGTGGRSLGVTTDASRSYHIPTWWLARSEEHRGEGADLAEAAAGVHGAGGVVVVVDVQAHRRGDPVQRVRDDRRHPARREASTSPLRRHPDTLDLC